MPAPVTVSTPNDTDIVMVRTFDAPASLVFAAHSQPELIRKWMIGPPGWTLGTSEMDLRVGGKWRHVWVNPEGKSFEMGGVFREVVPNRRIVHTEVSEGGEAVETKDFVEKNGRTTVTDTLTYASKEARDAALASGVAGMEGCYALLDRLLAERAKAKAL